MNNVSAIILAGGEGKRMKSELPKTLSPVLKKPMLQWVLDALKKAGINNICVVTGYKRECVEQFLSSLPFETSTAFQSERLGTGHAVMMADWFIKDKGGDVVILNGDAPFMDSETITEAYNYHLKTKSSATVISACVDDPAGYGRIVRNSDNSLSCIVEQKDASEEQQKITEVNSGAYWFNGEDLLSVLYDIKSNNAAKEYYLPDAVKLLLTRGKTVSAFTSKSPDTVLGANDPQQLEQLNKIAELKVQ